MILLLDTNAFIWWVSDDARLGRRARADIANATNDVYISNLSMFECSIKSKLGRLKIDFDAVDLEISEGRLLELRFDTLVARQFVDQQNLPQADPFDAAIVAQAVAKHMTLVTSDDFILDSSIEGLHSINAKK
ncbi:MAG TPA: type II toxin-antitoxin system VapC family toxin [Candidatus Saccharimonadales bacterium]|jgi:PIN domain nuclease of toxin-antitoxin system|nr:type II toxin-antitoxin system VapC family toxin [Candidatus Saccharimonadales bacterium]